jgi:hypothetical protein
VLATAAPTALAGAADLPTALALPPTAPPVATAPAALATSIPVPTIAAPLPTAAPPVAPAVQTTTQTSFDGSLASVLLEDSDWQGGFRRAPGQTYGGRTATWIYGSSTEYSTMRASFVLDGSPSGTASLTIEGMDSEGRTKTPIQLLVNGTEIYNGPNPLPDDDQPLETGTWASYSWSFDASLLHPGQNEINVSNLAEGAFSRPPFFMLDYATVTYSAR